ncbi:unnamed protein product [Cyclocybe aegerita]|uniref:Uncharacterized protein n=1 Tax=Cyclocybe aegerita TaxID=1973307 RepID=A0A8S0WKB8_CYCAE|nr:unnamed protein product [Cyclocybe aegerita]
MRQPREGDELTPTGSDRLLFPLYVLDQLVRSWREMAPHAFAVSFMCSTFFWHYMQKMLRSQIVAGPGSLHVPDREIRLFLPYDDSLIPTSTGSIGLAEMPKCQERAPHVQPNSTLWNLIEGVCTPSL